MILFGYVFRSKKSLAKIIKDALSKKCNDYLLHELVGIYNASLFICIYPVNKKI